MDLHNVNYIPQRDGYGQGLLALCAQRQDVLVLDADVSASTRTNWVKDQYPRPLLQPGHQRAGFGGHRRRPCPGGLIPYVSTYGVFLSGRAFDQLRTTVCYNNLKVRFGGAHAGISVGPDGATHQALEDMALARVLPPHDGHRPLRQRGDPQGRPRRGGHRRPCLLPLRPGGRAPHHRRGHPFTIGKARLVRQGTDCAVFACGPWSTRPCWPPRPWPGRGSPCG